MTAMVRTVTVRSNSEPRHMAERMPSVSATGTENSVVAAGEFQGS